MEWKPECDLLLLQEIIVSEPYQYKVSTREGGKIWEDITERLNANEAFAHRLGQKRAVRDQYTLLSRKSYLEEFKIHGKMAYYSLQKLVLDRFPRNFFYLKCHRE